MIRASAVQDKDVQKEICALCGIEYDADFMAYESRDDETGELLCCAQFSLAAGRTGVLESLGIADISEKAEKEFTKDGIMLVTGRAAMNFMDLAGFHKARLSQGMLTDRRTAKLLGFRPDESGEWTCDLSLLFTGERCGH